MQSRLIAAVLIATLVIAAGVVFAQTTRPGADRGAPGMDMRMGCWQRIAGELQLTPQQMQSLQALHQEFMTQTATTRENLRTEMRKLALLWANKQSTAEQIRAQADVVEGLKLQLRDTMIDYSLRARTILTDEQLAKITAWINSNPRLDFGKMCPWMGGHGKGGGMGGRVPSGK